MSSGYYTRSKTQQVDKMDEILEETKSSLTDTITQELHDLQREMAEIRITVMNLQTDNKFIQNDNKELRETMDNLTKENDEIHDINHYLEKEIHLLNQYTRRENLEISRIPDDIAQKDLEIKVIEIINTVGVKITSYGLVGCHRLIKKKHQKSANVIVRFIDRKKTIQYFKNKGKLNDLEKELGMRLFITENLCPAYTEIYNECYRQKKAGLINKLWTYNGVVNIKFTDDYYEKPFKVLHINDIKQYDDETVKITEKEDNII